MIREEGDEEGDQGLHKSDSSQESIEESFLDEARVSSNDDHPSEEHRDEIDHDSDAEYSLMNTINPKKNKEGQDREKSRNHSDEQEYD